MLFAELNPFPGLHGLATGNQDVWAWAGARDLGLVLEGSVCLSMYFLQWAHHRLAQFYPSTILVDILIGFVETNPLPVDRGII